MTKELRAIFEALNSKKDQVKALLAENKITEAEALMTEVRDLQKKADLQAEIDAQAQLDIPPIDPKPKDKNVLEYKDVFIKAFRGKKLTEAEASLLETKAALSSNTGEDGGFIIPQDIQTAIKELKRDLPILENFINVEPVGTLSGSRVVEKYADIVEFTEFAEGDDVPDATTPKFTNVPYEIKDKGGILPIPNNLMNDTDQNLMAYIQKWLLRKSIVTRNKMILALLETLTKVPLANYDAIKKVINVTLDPALAVGASIITNQDGFQYLDTLKTTTGEYILKNDITIAGGKTLEGKRIVVVSNKHLPTTGTTTKLAPVIIGDFNEFCTLFDRQQMSLLATNIGGTAFTKNRTDVRAIVRDTVSLVDADAVVYGTLDVTTPNPTPVVA